MKKIICLSLLTFTSLFADADLDAIKEQLKEQKNATKKLQDRIEQISMTPSTSASFSQTSFLPDIALILNMSAVSRNVKNSSYENYAIPGFIDKGTAEMPFNKDSGFNLNYAELAISSTVDPYFDTFTIFHLHPDYLEIDEAFVRTRALPYGLKVKAGKFKSSFGRINSKHQHAWNFDSQPIVYESMFGPDAISDAGVQLQWVAPTDTYIMAGIEAMQGNNNMSFGDVENNNLYVGYLKSSIDIGDDLSILGGVSLAHGKNLFSKNTDVYGVDLTLREQLGSYSSLIWQSEYLYRGKDVQTRIDKQSGMYSELIYHKNNNWSVGIRYDAIIQNDVNLQNDYANVNVDNLLRYTGTLEYKPFSFSRLRLQYTHDETKVIYGQRKTIHELMLSLNIATGAHGAHSY